MTGERNRILGINPGTRYLGLAVLDSQEILDWRIKSFNGAWTKAKEEKILNIIREKISFYGISRVAVKKLLPRRTTRRLNRLVQKIDALAKSRHVGIRHFTIQELEQRFAGESKRNSRNLAEAIVRIFPVLSKVYQREKSRKHAYYGRMIEAVALAGVDLKKIENL